jgi:hypothetical protein
MSQETRLHDPEYPKEPIDATMDSKGLLTLEDEDGERVVLSPVQADELFKWLAQLKADKEKDEATQKLNEDV